MEEVVASVALLRRRSRRRFQTRREDHHQHSIIDVQDYTSVNVAVQTVSRLISGRLPVETIKAEEAYGRLLSANIISPVNVPDKQRSHMDGFAVVARDLEGASSRSPRILDFVGDTDLVTSRTRRISSGEVAGISTGGKLPLGADAVVPVEHAKRVVERIHFFQEIEKGAFTFPIGNDVKKGSIVIRAGDRIRAQDAGMLALLGIRNVRAFARPRVAIIATGDELVDAFKANDPSKVRDSHSPIFANLIREVGGVVNSQVIVGDKIGPMTVAIRRALRSSDIVLTLGGTSLGEGDLVEQVLLNISKRSRIIHGVRMDRGRVAGIAAVQRKPVVMLPGPVQGAMNAFFLLALPLILKMSSGKDSVDVVSARLSKDWKARKRFEDFTKVLYVQLGRSGETLSARPVVGETESMGVLTKSNGFVVVPERVRELRAGHRVSVRLLPGFSYAGGGFHAGVSARIF